jgi:transcriptional regulator with XRE-family HTH domain
MAADALPGSTFAERLDHLFRTVKRDPSKLGAAGAEGADGDEGAEGPDAARSISGHRRRRQLYSVREVAAALGMSHTHLGNLRTGTGAANDPRWSEIVALAKFFGCDVSYLAPVPDHAQTEPAPSPEHEMLRMARERPGVELVLLRMHEADLSPAGAAMVASMIDQVAVVEEAARRSRESGNSPGGLDGGGGVAAQR